MKRLAPEIFECVVEHTPLVSIDLILVREGRVLLGRRKNPPAKGYWFTLGGRVFKNERIREAIRRIMREETGREVIGEQTFIGVFEHLYDDGIFENVSTHYINLAYRIAVEEMGTLPTDQHEAYRWFTLKELMESPEVHPYVKDYFTQEKGTIPQ
ncbi:GDP-mannose mannosyl hydrolase [Hydrogenimonas urashimensis]|uniref:GDP-mannose mannosyl hydrolase n=1 Tax=Hydrogenimonas urashimensis TaxID=2740515 RepID=UPI00191647C8|nr:NUDIX domain-containing protein [Hydrogenimonas urashimensis]